MLKFGSILVKKDSKKLINFYQLSQSISIATNIQVKNRLVLPSNNQTNQYVKYKLNQNSQKTLLVTFSTTNTVDTNKEWTKILTRAEKIVGYPTSFLNLRYLVSDEVANFANLIRKLMKTKHPLINIARRLVLTGGDNDSKKSMQINGILVLLIAKAAGIPNRSKQFLDNEISDGIHQSQRSLAEITEMIYMGSLIHKGIIDLKTIGNTVEYQEMDQGDRKSVV